MFIIYTVVTVLVAAVNAFAAANDVIRPKWLLANMAVVGAAKRGRTETRV